jgi:SAM-dependent methyltransferase
MPIDQPGREGTYVINAELATETARLWNQDRLTTEAMGGLFPERDRDLSGIQKILDIGCGPGSWVLDVAHEYYNDGVQVVGIDTSTTTIEYARARAEVMGLSDSSVKEEEMRVRFLIMDAQQPLSFPNDSFDLVNARYIVGFMRKTDWSRLLAECLRILRPGGVIRLSESEWPISTSPALEKLGWHLTRAIWLAGQSFSPDGRHIGITPVLGRLLDEAGFTNIQKKAHLIDFSIRSASYRGWYENFTPTFTLMEPFLEKMNVASPAEVEELLLQMQSELLEDSFCGLASLITTWGEKPE